jgi:hypothetical protein
MKKVMLVTKEIARKLPAIGATEGKKPAEIQVAFKIFNPYGAQTWYVTEGNLETGELFGLADLGNGTPELGYMSLQEFEEIKVGRFQLPLERDRHYSGTLADAMKEAGYGFQEAA